MAHCDVLIGVTLFFWFAFMGTIWAWLRAIINLCQGKFTSGVDLAITQSDVFEYFRTERKTPGLQKRINYILRLRIAELHILAKTDIQSISRKDNGAR